MLSRFGWAFLGVVLLAQGARTADLAFLERFALARDRAEVLKELVPGTADYYYFTSLYHQEKGQLDEAETLINAWIARDGESERTRELQNRQALFRYPTAPQETLDYLKSHFALELNHQRHVPGEAPDLPTALDPSVISRETLLQTAKVYGARWETLENFWPHAYPWLIAIDLTPGQLRNLLGKLETPDYPRLPELIAKDLDVRNSGGFGSHEIHRKLTREQLDALLALKPDLLDNDTYIGEYMRRLLPGNDNLNWQREPALMEAYLDRLWAFVQRLSPAQTSIKAHVLYHRLKFDQSQGNYDKDRFIQYLQIPRYAAYVNPDYMKKGENERYPADLARDFNEASMLPPVGSDVELVEGYLRHFLAEDNSYRAFAPYVREAELKLLAAETALLSGQGDLEHWYAQLDPASVEALKDRVDIDFAPENKQRFGVGETVTLDVWVKNVDRLLVKIFEIDTKNYYQQFNREINTAIDLDGLVANHEQVYTYEETPLHRVRREFTFPELQGRGVWVLEFVGNGTSSRAVVAKGSLQYLDRTGPAGQVFTVFDESGAKVPDASVWFAGRTYTAGEAGEIVLPFSTDRGKKPLLLCAGDFASLASFTHETENYNLVAGFHIDRESLRAGAMATVAVRPLLYLNGTAMPLSLIQQPVIEIRSHTHDGIESTQRINNIELKNEAFTLQPFRVPDNLAQLTVAFSGTIEPLTGSEPQTLQRAESFQVNGIHASEQTATLLLTQSDAGYALEMRDKTGLPLADRGVNLMFSHLDFNFPIPVALKTDGQGRIALGALEDIRSLEANADQIASSTWYLQRPAATYPGVLQGSTDEALRVPYLGKTPNNLADVVSLLERRHGKYVADRTDALALEEGYIILSGLSAGDYVLHLKGNTHIDVRLTEGSVDRDYVASDARLLSVGAPSPLQIQAIDTSAAGAKIKVGGGNSLTRVHVIATRFLPERSLFDRMNQTQRPGVATRPIAPGYALYTSSRQLGDEYRYVLERRFAEKYPGNMLERPSLLLNPWAIDETEASQDEAAADEAMRAMAAPPAPAESEPAARKKEFGDDAMPYDISPAFDFLDGDGAAFYNLEPDENGVVILTAEELQGRTYLQVVASDPTATVSRYATLPAQAWTPRDLRLARALDPSTHVVEQKRVQALAGGATLKVSLAGDANVQIYDSVPSVLNLLMALNTDATLREFSFLARWPQLSDEEKRAKFSEFESHELNFFLYHKDRTFFDATVAPYLANKYQKTFLDHWLLENDLSAYLEPWRLGQLNLVEKILLAKRLTSASEAVVPYVRDAVDLIPPNPGRFNALFMTALYGGALGGDTAGFAVHDMVMTDMNGDAYGPPGNGGFDPRDGVNNGALFFSVGAEDRAIAGLSFDGMRSSAGLGGAAKSMAEELRGVEQDADKIRRYIEEGKQLPEGADAKGIKQHAFRVPEIEETFNRQREMELRGLYKALYLAPEATKAYAENNYYEIPLAQTHAGLIPMNAFWLDYATADPAKPFLSAHIAEAASSRTEALLALAVLDLPFEAPEHEQTRDADALTLKPGGAGIAFYKDIAPAATADSETPLLVSQNFFRRDDRFRYEGNQQFDKFVTGEFLTNVVYGCQITVTNPTSTPLQVEVLHQVPAGALPVGSGRYTKSDPMGLDGYSTARMEYFFYFPLPGEADHYPVHVSQEGTLLAFAAADTMQVVDVPTTVDTSSWLYVSQQGSAAEVLAFLRDANLNRLDLNLMLWRMKDQVFFQEVIALLNARLIYRPEIWAYAIAHNDTEALRTYLRYRDDFVAQSGPALESALLDIDPVERKIYQHIEYMPLINPRAHDLDRKWLMTNTQLQQQFAELISILAHRPALTQPDRLALCYYLLLQDRIGEALDYFETLQPEALDTRVQYDYLAAYLAFYREEPAAAAAIAANYTDYPVARWRTKFAGVAAQAAEIAGQAGGANGEARPTQDTLAAQEPRLDLEMKEDSVVLYYQNLPGCTLSFYPIDLEMLFTRSAFALAGADLFAGVKPVATQTVTFDASQAQVEVPLPAEFVARHVVIKADAAGISKSDIRYATKLIAQAVERYGQVQVTSKADNKPLSKVYVKVFAEMSDGGVQFYRDGYTDLRGRFDYASSSTLDLGQVKRFAVLVISEEFGAKVLTAAPPAR